MSDWTKLDDYKLLPVGTWLVKCDGRRSYQVATVSRTSNDTSLVIVGYVFSWDAGKLIAYKSFEGFEE